MQVHPGRVKQYLEDRRGTPVERIKNHPVLDGTGKGLLDRVAIVVAGARFGRGASGTVAAVIEFSFRGEA